VVGLDTNVLVRYLTRDDESQWQQASEVIESGHLCFIANIVLCELVWVLRGNPYKFGREEILSALEMMLQSPAFEFENRSALYQALQRAKQECQLRHRWAVRTLEYGLDISLAAQQMRHSVQVHSDIYHHWITEDVHRRAFNALMLRPDRPRPPKLD